MTGKTHLAAGTALGIGLCLMTQPSPVLTAITIGTSAIGSLLPDIDTASSKIGRRIAPLAWVLRILFGHRKLFHSLAFWSVTLGGLWLLRVPQTLLIGLALGIGSHLLLDILNPAGIELLWPIPVRFSLGGFQCGGLMDNILFVLLSGFNVYAALHFAIKPVLSQVFNLILQ